MSRVTASLSARMRSGRIPRWLLPLAVLTTVAVLWQNAEPWFGIPPYFLPSPQRIWQAFAKTPALYLTSTWITLRAGLTGFVIGNLIAIVLASLFLYGRGLERAFMPILLTLRSVPLVAVTPLLVLLFGRGDGAKITVVAIICFFPMMVNVAQGLTHVNPAALEMMDMLAASPMQVYFKIRLPSALPMFFAALRITATSAILSAVVAEFIGAGAGLGSVMVEAFASYEAIRLWVGIIISTIIAVVLFLLAAFLEQRTIPWHESVTRQRPGAQRN